MADFQMRPKLLRMPLSLVIVYEVLPSFAKIASRVWMIYYMTGETMTLGHQSQMSMSEL